MRLSIHALRFAAAGAMILGVVSASPAAAQSTVVLTVKAPKSITPGSTADYTISLANSGPSTARGATLTVTMPPEVTQSAVTGVAAAGCSTVTAANTFTCPLDDIQDQTTATVVVTVSLDLPTPLTCPNGATIGTFTAAVSGTGITQDATNSTPTVASVPQDDIADVGVTLDGPDAVQEGQDVTFTGTVTNAGPCPTTNVDIVNGAGPGMVFKSGVGIDGTPSGLCAEEAECVIPAMAVGETHTFKRTYTVQNVPADLMHSGVPNELDVSSDLADPNSKNDSATTLSLINVSGNTGCASAGGTAGLAGVAAMLLVALARRRRA